jgi:NAD(P)-dependent dehydrogenase (short-subunit alcohol dehydrogenase family)
VLREIFETNLFGQIDLTNRLLPAMRRVGDGRVVMVSSVLGIVAAPWRGAYVATKFALEGITDTVSA